jgi:outer membrane protein assembly factor BamA
MGERIKTMTRMFGWMLALLMAPMLVVAQDAGDGKPLIVEELQCRGNAFTSCYFILSYLDTRPGNDVNEEELQNAKLRLSSLPNFTSVDVFLERGSEKGHAIVVIEVQEASPLATELVAGTSARLGSLSQKFAGRISHRNIFGTGKILDLTVVDRTPINGLPHDAQFANLRYVDPHLSDSKQLFLVAGLTYLNNHDEYDNGDFHDHEQSSIGASIGRRMWDYGYLTTGYQFRPRIYGFDYERQSNGSFHSETDTNHHVLSWELGWNSEDDFYFPTRGFGLVAGLGYAFGSQHDIFSGAIQFRKTWKAKKNYLILKVGQDPSTQFRSSFDSEGLDESQAVSFAVARPLSFAAPGQEVQRGRWYIEQGISAAGYDQFTGGIFEVAIKAGVRLETKTFGIVDLYFIGSKEVRVEERQ